MVNRGTATLLVWETFCVFHLVGWLGWSVAFAVCGRFHAVSACGGPTTLHLRIEDVVGRSDHVMLLYLSSLLSSSSISLLSLLLLLWISEVAEARYAAVKPVESHARGALRIVHVYSMVYMYMHMWCPAACYSHNPPPFQSVVVRGAGTAQGSCTYRVARWQADRLACMIVRPSIT